MPLTPRQKLIGVTLSLGVTLAMAGTHAGWGAASAARLGLGATALGGLSLLLWRARAQASAAIVRAPARLRVVQRVGLSQRSALALIEVEGRAFIVIHGDGFARIRPAPRRLLTGPPRASERRQEPTQ